MIKFILTDIEGTTTSIDFVHKVLFPFSKEHLASYIKAHASNEKVAAALKEVQTTVSAEENRVISPTEALEYLQLWIEKDRKHPALKKLQGNIWKSGYEQGAYKGHIYDDVQEVLQKWHKENRTLAIYSSGSIEAQQLLFGHSEKGNLTEYFTQYFDTAVGAKKEVSSYRKIAEVLGAGTDKILFLSDIEEELDAARAAGYHTIQLVREGTTAGTKHPLAHDFNEVDDSVKMLDVV